MTTITEEQQKALAKMREAFPAHQISKLCRSTRKDNAKGNCKVCGGFHGLPAITLDYVGHAALTDRLLEADPAWSWEPMATDAMGYPAIDKDGGMWIKLTIAGITRYGYGDAQGKSGGDAMKERIGDALRNAAMRFGAALDLWHKGELHADESGEVPTKVKEDPKKGKEPAQPSAAQTELLNLLGATYTGDNDQMADALHNYSSFMGKDKDGVEVERYLKLADLEHSNSNEKFQRWVSSALSKLKKDLEKAA